MGKFVDLKGQKFSQLLIIDKAKNRCKRVRWDCLCDCGNRKIAFSNLLQKGVTRNCGSKEEHKSNRGGAQYTYHGLASTQKYKMYMRAKGRAKSRELPFSITLSEMPEIPKYCPILGIPLYHANIKGARNNSPSLDKIVPGKGYVKGNVQIISSKANRMKSNATTEEVGRLYRYLLQMDKEIVG